MQTKNDPDIYTTFQAICKKFNLKVTPQRIAVYDAVISAHDHPSTDAVFRKVQDRHPNISFDTVNRTLNTFAEIGVIDPVEGHGAPKRYDPNLAVHHHFHCIQCGAIIDLYPDMFKRIEIPSELEKKFTVTAKRILLKGYCARCRTEQKSD